MVTAESPRLSLRLMPSQQFILPFAYVEGRHPTDLQGLQKPIEPTRFGFGAEIFVALHTCGTHS